MASFAKIRTIDGELAAVLSPEAIAHLKVQDGDEIVALWAEASIVLHRKNAELEAQMRLIDQGARRYRNALAELAKS